MKVQLTPCNNPVPVFWIGLSSIKCKSQRSHRVKDTSAYSPELLTIDDIFRICLKKSGIVKGNQRFSGTFRVFEISTKQVIKYN